jgi:3-phenylpropionate/cinnamic acid dioxygenase small subunit
MQAGYSDAAIASLREQIRCVEYEAAIRTLYARLAQSADERRLDDYLPLFAEDAIFEIVGRARQQGVAGQRSCRAQQPGV